MNQKHEEKYNRRSPVVFFFVFFWFTPETEKQDRNKFIILNYPVFDFFLKKYCSVKKLH